MAKINPEHVRAAPETNRIDNLGAAVQTKGSIIPAAVGVDIDYGMMACETSLTANDLPYNLFDIRSAIEKPCRMVARCAGPG